MDTRWFPVQQDSKRDVRIYLHRTASIGQVRRGDASDGVDLSPYVSQGSQTQFDCTLTLNWNVELFGSGQPKPNNVLEVQLLQHGIFLPVWIGVIESLSSVRLDRGERSMQLIARSRETQDIWKTTKRVTPLYPQMTDITFIAEKLALAVGLTTDEVNLPASGITTYHTNTQLAEMPAWEMLTALFLPLGWTPTFDSLGRLKRARRDLQSAQPDVILKDNRIVKVGASRVRPPATRVRLKWLDPALRKSLQQGRKLQNVELTTGWFLPYIQREVFFSDDRTQRAEDTFLWIRSSANTFVIPFCQETWEQTGENKGELRIFNVILFSTLVALLIAQSKAAHTPDGINETAQTTIPVGRVTQQAIQLSIMAIMMAVGTGVYEIWGTPFDWVHSKNTTEVFDATAPPWADNPVEVDSDFVKDEQHALSIAVRELIYIAKSANKWTVHLVDDPRLEFGDILQFPDGNRMYIEDFTRNLARGSEAVLEVRGFLIGGATSTTVFAPVIANPLPPISTSNPVIQAPQTSGGGIGSSSTNPIIPMSGDPATIAADVRASLAFYGRTDDAYWIGLCDHVSNGFSDGVWRLGWSRYWEVRADPSNTGSADVAFASEPALHTP